MKTFGTICALLTLGMLTACGPYPRDIEGTADKVAESGRLRVGYGAITPDQYRRAQAFVARVAAASAAGIDAREDTSNEALFAALEKGDLDLVVTEVADDSPWLTEVAVIDPLSHRRVGERRLGLSPVARNGENRWVALLERQQRDMQAGS